ncbi:MAG: hypothetical protein WD065_00595 [Planctomycetaceae bacterium]
MPYPNQQRTTIDVCSPAWSDTFTCTTECTADAPGKDFEWDSLSPRIRDLLSTLNALFNSPAERQTI